MYTSPWTKHLGSVYNIWSENHGSVSNFLTWKPWRCIQSSELNPSEVYTISWHEDPEVYTIFWTEKPCKWIQCSGLKRLEAYSMFWPESLGSVYSFLIWKPGSVYMFGFERDPDGEVPQWSRWVRVVRRLPNVMNTERKRRSQLFWPNVNQLMRITPEMLMSWILTLSQKTSVQTRHLPRSRVTLTKRKWLACTRRC